MRLLTATSSVGLVLLALFLAGCDAGNGDGLDENGQPLETPTNVEAPSPEPQPAPTPENVTLGDIQEQVFTPFCVECHAGATAPLGLRLDSVNNSFNLLVNQSSVELSQFLRVNPGDPDNSYLVKKIEGSPDIVGGQMPLNRAPLDEALITLVRQWITEGAMP